MSVKGTDLALLIGGGVVATIGLMLVGRVRAPAIPPIIPPDSPPITCLDGDVKLETCLDGSTVNSMLCSGGEWIEYPGAETCPGPQCIEGAVRNYQCSDGSVRPSYECVDGMWRAASTQFTACPLNNTWKVAFVVNEAGRVADQADFDNLERLKSEFITHFFDLTNGLGHIDPAIPTFVINDADVPYFQFSRWKATQPDVYHFVYVFQTVDAGAYPGAYYISRKQPFHGIGKNDPWPSETKLLGMVSYHGFLNEARGSYASIYWNVSRFSLTSIHEIGHTWMHYIRYLSTDGQVKPLFSTNDWSNCMCHLDGYVRSTPHTVMSTGNQWWQDVNTGVWYNGSRSTPLPVGEEYNLDFYLMGLIPKEQVHPIHKLNVTGTSPDGMGFYATEEIITVDQIIAVEGEWWEV